MACPGICQDKESQKAGKKQLEILYREEKKK